MRLAETPEQRRLDEFIFKLVFQPLPSRSEGTITDRVTTHGGLKFLTCKSVPVTGRPGAAGPFGVYFRDRDGHGGLEQERFIPTRRYPRLSLFQPIMPRPVTAGPGPPEPG